MTEAVWEGLLLIDKPSGPTSHDVVRQIRRSTGQRRIGHAGTLDPMASGLLPLVLGTSTRLVRFMPHSPKTYTGTLTLGLTSVSDDITGEITSRHTSPLPPASEVLAAATELVGESEQVAPTVSAKKVGGQRLYRLARRGIDVDRPVATIQVGEFRLRPTERNGVFAFTASVSRGTYIRGLARDLGQRLGCGGVLSELRRTRIAQMDVSAAYRPEAGVDCVPEDLYRFLTPPAAMPLEAGEFRLREARSAERFRQGTPLDPGPEPPPGDAPLRVLDPEGRLLGIAELSDGLVRPRVVLPPVVLSGTVPRLDRP